MSQSGYTPILVYASGTASNVPLAANLTSSASGAELALNYADGKLFYKDSGGTVQVLATKGTGPIGGSNTQVQYNSSGALAGSANFTYVEGANNQLTVSSSSASYFTSTVGANTSYFGTNGSGTYIGSGTNVSVLFYQNNTEQMRLTSTGLGIGTNSPAYKLDVNGGSQLYGNIITNPGSTFYNATGDLYIRSGTGGKLRLGANGNNDLAILDSSGNLGLGVTPSAWSGQTALQLVGSSAIASNNQYLDIQSNSYYNAGSKYITTGLATRYTQAAGAHQWFNAPSGTAGNAITFTQAMTLDASGNLLVGTTTANAKGYIYQGTAGNDTLWVENGAGNNVFRYKAASGFDNYFDFYAGASSGSLIFRGAGTERARITSGGFFKASDVGTYVGSTGAYHELVSSTGSATAAVYIRNTNATSPAGIDLSYSGASPNGTGNTFLYCQDSTALRASIRSNGGIANYQANDVNLSDRREKTNFAPAKSYLDTICAIPVQTFNYIDQSEDDPGLTLGVVAQDVQAVAPELVSESNWGTEEDPKMRLSIYQTDLQYALMKCIQELKAEVDSLKAQLEAK